MDNVIEIVNAGKKIKNNLILKNVNLKLEKGKIYGQLVKMVVVRALFLR